MKKFLLFFAAFAAVLSLNAETKTVVYDFKTNDYGLPRQTENSGPYIDNDTKLTVNDGTEITLTKKLESNGWRLWSDGLRVYKNSDAGMTITVTKGAIKKIEFKTKANNTISKVSTVEVSGNSFGVACDGNSIPLEFTVKNNGAIETLTLTVDTEGKGTSTEVSALEGGETPEPVETTIVKSIAETVKLAAKTPIKVDYFLTVAFRNFNNVFCFDEAGDFIQLYGANDYEANDVIAAGWEAVYDLYNTTPEITPGTAGFPAASSAGDFKAKVVAAKDITTALVNHVILVEGVEFSVATPAAKENFNGKSDDVDLTFRNNYTLESQEPGKYNVEAVVSVYQDKVQLYPIEFTKADGSSVAEIETANGVTEYYSLQGEKVMKPENGIFIRVQNNKATKVIVK